MGKTEDSKLGMDRAITRRDFLNGVAVGVGGIVASEFLPGIVAAEAHGLPAQDRPGYNPPALTGMRGSHPGSFEAAHTLRDGNFWKHAGTLVETGETYDLVIVGAGIGGLAAAHFHLKQNPSARILILDNHDDFGGHAKRNEFRPGGRLLLANGGTWAIESPYPYSDVARGLMTELGIDPPALEEKCTVEGVYKGLSDAVFFDRETFGADQLAAPLPWSWMYRGSETEWRTFAERTPFSPAARRDLVRLETETTDFLPGLTSDQKKDRLSRISYKNFLLTMVKIDPSLAAMYQTRTHDLFGAGIDAVSALDCWALRQPGFDGLKLEPGPYRRMGYTPKGFTIPKPAYTFHFPDGNASVARMLVRRLIPHAAPGSTAEDIVTAKFDYAALDPAAKSPQPVRIRLSSIAVRARHAGDTPSAKEVEVSYIRPDKKIYSVRGKNVILACWNMMIPFLCPDLPAPQKEALRYGAKVPLVYTSVAIRNWHAFRKLGVNRVYCPGMYHHLLNLDATVDIGDYRSPKSPDDPVLVRMERTPCLPGLPERDQHRAGRGDLLGTPFETFERSIRDQLARVLGAGGFDPARDIEAITVNRWPHGYAYEYNPLWDPDWAPGQSPCEIARKRFGRIAIANSDAAAAAYTDRAIDESYRAVQELSLCEEAFAREAGGDTRLWSQPATRFSCFCYDSENSTGKDDAGRSCRMRSVAATSTRW